MSSFNFRLRFLLGPNDAVGFSESAATLPTIEEGVSLELKAVERDKPIQEVKNLVVLGKEWNSERAALEVGARVKVATMLALASLRVGADFGDRKGSGFFFPGGLKMLEEQVGGRVVNDVHGLMAFEAEPRPRFGAVGEATFTRTIQPERFVAALRRAYQANYSPSDAEALSFELYNASFFERTSRTRFLVLVMAIEALLKPGDRRPEAREHVEKLLAHTRDSEVLTPQEKSSMQGSLRWLLQESISHTGRQLALARLGDRRYMNLPPERFFGHCYDLRSQLVHGMGVRGDEPIVGTTAASLEIFVADLLAGFRVGFDA